jgi:hypothetical protein
LTCLAENGFARGVFDQSPLSMKSVPCWRLRPVFHRELSYNKKSGYGKEYLFKPLFEQETRPYDALPEFHTLINSFFPVLALRKGVIERAQQSNSRAFESDPGWC